MHNTYVEVKIMQLTEKERTLLKDLKGQEKLCVDKYTRYSSEAIDPQLKNLFSQIASSEQNHFNGLTQLEGGTVPTVGGGQNNSPTFTATYTAETPEKQADCYLCGDVLSTEKHASALYDTCIFEFCDQQARTYLAGIQEQEQNHGKMIYDYMKVNGMYS